MESFPPNSRKATQAQGQGIPEPKRVERVTTAEAHQRKKGLGKQFKETFISGDAKTTAHYVFTNTILPGAKDLLFDSVTRTIEGWLFGEGRGSGGRRPPSASGYSSNLGHVAYNRMSQGPAQARPVGRQMTPQGRQQHNFGEIEVASRAEANDVLDGMFDLLSQYEVVTVADLYALTGIAGTHQDRKWGWTDLRGANVRRNTRSGNHVLDLPRPEYLDA